MSRARTLEMSAILTQNAMEPWYNIFSFSLFLFLPVWLSVAISLFPALSPPMDLTVAQILRFLIRSASGADARNDALLTQTALASRYIIFLIFFRFLLVFLSVFVPVWFLFLSPSCHPSLHQWSWQLLRYQCSWSGVPEPQMPDTLSGCGCASVGGVGVFGQPPC